MDLPLGSFEVQVSLVGPPPSDSSAVRATVGEPSFVSFEVSHCAHNGRLCVSEEEGGGGGSHSAVGGGGMGEQAGNRRREDEVSEPLARSHPALHTDSAGSIYL